jgi:NADH:ubiquinone oxidoreductase subunit 5 (subunit L)/multisubunit Na+/H+ antiporter MnhA subunit
LTDSWQSLLALATLLAPLVAAAGIAASGLTGDRRLGRALAMLGAAVSFCAAAAALARLSVGGLDADTPLDLGVWLNIGPRDPTRIAFAIAMDLPAAGLSTVISLCTLCAIGWNPVNRSDGPSERLLYIAVSLLLASSLGIALSTNVGELFVFWQIAAVSAYLMSSAAASTAPRAAAVKKFILTQRVAEFWLLCAVLAVAFGYRTVDFGDLFAYLRTHGAAQRFALVHFVGLCLLGACVGRCALIPFLGWIDGLATGPALAWVLVEGICLMPAGVLLLIRFLPILHAAEAASAFGVFLGGASAFFAAICAWSESDVRRQAGFACASVFGIVVLGLSLPVPTAAAWGVVLTATFLPTSSAILGWFAASPRTMAERDLRGVSAKLAALAPVAVAVSIALLFSGICGQGGILAAGLRALAEGGATLALALLLTLCAQFFAALAMTRALLASRTTRQVGVSVSSPEFDPNVFESRPIPSTQRPSWPLIVLAGCGIAVGLLASALTLAARPSNGDETDTLTLGGGSLVATLFGCLPALAGFLAGWRQPLREPANRPSHTTEGLLARLGRSRFYCDPLLFVLIVLPVRGLAQFARFVDWFFIDGFVYGAPASAVESAEVVLEPIQGRSVSFYLASAAVGTALLAAVVVWLRY